MGKHSSPKASGCRSAAGLLAGLTTRSAGRHSAAAAPHATAAEVLEANRRGPVMAAIAIPTAAAAAVMVAGAVNMPSGAEVSAETAPVTAPAATLPDAQPAAQADAKALRTAQKQGGSASHLTGHLATPKPKPTAKPAKDSGYSGPKNSKASGQGGTCEASMYGNGDGTDGGPTASGETFHANAMTAAHKTLPLGSVVKVTNKSNGKSATVRINDRGPYISGRCLDLSVAAMKAVGGYSAGTINVSYKVL